MGSPALCSSLRKECAFYKQPSQVTVPALGFGGHGTIKFLSRAAAFYSRKRVIF
jgi:hypothetical protein